MSELEVDVTRRKKFEQVYARTREPILGYLLRRVSVPSDAADLLAETYLVAWRRVDDLPDGDESRLWLYGVARKVLANYRRHGAVERRLADKLRAGLRTSLPPASTESTTRLDQAIADCLASLSAQDRELIELVAYEGLTPTEIAGIVGQSAGHVRVRLHRARRTLTLQLVRAGVSSPRYLEACRQ